jgi:hypothetical protein
VGDDAPRSIRGGQLGDGVAGPTELERAYPLEVLALEEQLAARSVVEGSAGEHRRAMDMVGDPIGSGTDGGKINGVGGHGAFYTKHKRYT